MAGMLGSAFVQEAVSRVVSSVLGKREERASQSHLMERLEIAVSDLEIAHERAKELRIIHLSQIARRKQIKSRYVEAMDLLDKHKQQQEVPARQQQQRQDARGGKRKRWVIYANNFTSSSAGLSTDDVRRFERFADSASKFVRDVVSGCSLYQNTFCSPILRHLLDGKTLLYSVWDKHANLERGFYISPMYSYERGLEVELEYWYEDRTMNENSKCFRLTLVLRLSECTDIVGVAIKVLQSLTSQFKIVAECAMGELTQLSSLQDITHSYNHPLVRDSFISRTQFYRPDPACCQGNRLGLCANNNVSSELSHIFPEEVIFWYFRCNWVPALEPGRSSCRSKSRGGGKPRLLMTACFMPHHEPGFRDRYAVQTMGDVKQYIDPNIQQLAEALNKSDTINCFFRQPELTKYEIDCYYKHGFGWFTVNKASTRRVGTPNTKRSNTRGSTRRSSRG